MTYDIVIFGATGFTGQFVVEELAEVLAVPDAPKLTWAVAGRNEGKLKQVNYSNERRVLLNRLYQNQWKRALTMTRFFIN